MLGLVGRAQLAYVGIFFLACIGLVAYEANYVWPVERCEGHGGWWSAKFHECATPIPIWRITGRIPQGTSPISRPSTSVSPPS
jgi:hypothetical protein